MVRQGRFYVDVLLTVLKYKRKNLKSMWFQINY